MARSDATKKKIANSLQELLKTRDLDSITIDDLCQSCQIHRRTFYYHFEDKFDLVRHIYDDARSQIPALSETGHWIERVRALLTSIAENRLFFKRLNKSVLLRDFTNYTLTHACEHFEHVIKSELKNRRCTGAESARAARYFAYGLTMYVVYWIRQGLPESPDELADTIRKLTENGLKKLASDE